MSSYDEVPVSGPALADWQSSTEEENEEFLRFTFKDIARDHHDRRHFHDKDGFYAEYAWSKECLALGHVKPDVYLDAEDDPYFESNEHAWGWDSDVICMPTRYGTACTVCEGECPFDVDLPDLWALVALAGGDDRG